MKVDDILFSIAGALGRIGIVGEEIIPANTNQALAIIRLKQETNVSVNFLSKYFISDNTTEQIEKLRGGVAQQNLSLAQLNDLQIPIPPIIEQNRIISILNEAFAVIDQAKENLQRNLQNAKELFESEMNSIFQNKGKSWLEKKLGDICDVEYGYTDKSIHEGDYRYVRITDIDKNGELILEDKKYIKHSKELESFLINDNDLLMARTGATFAKVLLFNDDEPSVFASYLIRIKFKEKIENKLYWYFTKTPNYWEQANSLASGSAQPHFNGAALKQVVFSYPVSVNEQKLLIKKFDTLSVETKNLENIYQQKLDNLEELKKSILQKAFNGELSSPERASSANDGHSPSKKKIASSIESPERA